MRYIVIALVLANLGFLVWNYTQPMAVTPEPQPRPLLNTGLTLISEFEAQTRSLAQDARRQCSVVTGFGDLVQANDFAASARVAGLQTLVRREETSQPPQFRVYLPPTPSREIANLTLEDLSDRLAAAELAIETYLITRGELENAVALGVYPTRAAAQQVRSQVLQLGYTPFLEELRAAEGEIQVILRPPDSEQVDEAEWLDLSAENGALSRFENLCQTIAQATQFQ